MPISKSEMDALKTIDQFYGSRSLLVQGRSLRSRFIVFGRPGGICGEPEPDPIPNSAVKLPCADGTKPQGLEE